MGKNRLAVILTADEPALLSVGTPAVVIVSVVLAAVATVGVVEVFSSETWKLALTDRL